MESTHNKKRRNLMLTASAVVAASLLQLERPGLILTAVISPATVTAAWRFWVVVLVVLAYQTWRLYTDKNTHELYKAAARVYGVQLGDIIRSSLAKRAFTDLRRVHAGDNPRRG